MKRVLILSGGGSHGAYQVGVLKRLIELGNSWDVIAGVSVGALNGTYLALHNKADIAKAMQDLEATWRSIQGTKDVITPWLPGFLNYFAAFIKGSMKSTKPLLKLILSKYDETALRISDVDMRVGAVALGEGKYHTISKETADFHMWILASATMPVVMPPVPLNGDKWVDGGVRDQTPVRSVLDVIEDCYSRKEEVAIDVIVTSSKKGIEHKRVKGINNLLEVGARCAEIGIDEINVTDLEPLYHLKNVTIYRPENTLTVDPMEFPPDSIHEMIETGYAETAKLK